jgi:basic membrane lipoprotein Med (substrate-binding protein (PBP1-ABC) superfamily)
MARPFAFWFLLWLLAAAIAACDRPGAHDAPGSGAFRAALLSPGPVNDNGWNAGAYEGLLEIEKQLGGSKAQQQVKTPAEIEDGFRRNAQKGASIVFGHGFEFGDYALKVAKEFPNTAFVVSAGAPNAIAANVASMVWRVEDAAYLCGVIAAKISKTGRAGCIGGVDIPPVRSAFDAFAEGAKSVSPTFEVKQAYVGDWHDIGAARAQALSMIEAGCDTLFHDADAAGLGMLEAAQQKKVFAFGCTKDQSASAPDAVVASAVIDVPKSFVAMAREVREGKFRGRRVEWTRRSGTIGLVWNEKLKNAMPAGLATFIDELDRKIESGEIKVRYTAP